MNIYDIKQNEHEHIAMFDSSYFTKTNVVVRCFKVCGLRSKLYGTS